MIGVIENTLSYRAAVNLFLTKYWRVIEIYCFKFLQQIGFRCLRKIKSLILLPVNFEETSHYCCYLYIILYKCTGCPTILAPLCFLLLSRVMEHVQRNFWPFFNSPGNLLYDSHKNFENWFRNSLDNWGQSCHL